MTGATRARGCRRRERSTGVSGFLRRGWLAAGFARFQCAACGIDRLVAFSCKGRGFCPSCGRRRMAERAAHLVDSVFPDVPVRQWVLSLPYRVRYRLAWDHDLCRAVAIVQRFGGAQSERACPRARVGRRLRESARAPWRFIPCLVSPRWMWRRCWPPWSRGSGACSNVGDLAIATTRAARRMRGRRRHRCWPGWRRRPYRGPWRWRSSGARASVGWVTRPRRAQCPSAATVTPARTASISMPQSSVPEGQRERLERVCRYALRPPVAGDRVCVTGDGQVLLQLRHPWIDGTTHLVFDPLEFLGRLAVLVPRPRINLILYSGVLGARAAWRSAVVRRETSDSRKASAKRPVLVRPAREPGQARQERGRRVGEARLRRGVEGRRHHAHD